MRRAARTIMVVGLAVAVFAVGALGLWKHAEEPTPAAAGTTGSALRSNPDLGSGTLAATIDTLQARVKAVPGDWDAMASLGLSYVQQARVTADPSYYPKADSVLRRSLATYPVGNFNAEVGMAALAAARHDFAGALDWGRKAEAVNPYNGGVHDVVGDALIELGRYPQAFAEIQKAVDTKPNLSSYARGSYALELQGDVTTATKVMELALQAAGTDEDRAWALNQLGELAFNAGRLHLAERDYRRAVQTNPSFIPPRAGLAKVEAARGEFDRAIADYRWVVTRYPLPEYVIALGDVEASAGMHAEAEVQYGLLRVEEDLFEANGVNMDLEIALFDADHRVSLSAGLAAARSEWGRRHSIHVADALAWELYANGRANEALRFANEALHLGTRNALFLFHRGMIEKALGRTDAARRDLAQALSINPHFSILWSRTAARTLAELGGSP